MEPIFCPKPRRLGSLRSADAARPFRRHLGHQADPSDSRCGEDVLDIILSKGSYNGGRGEPQRDGESPAASSPPYFCGSPPIRAANPLVLDARFGEEGAPPPCPLPALAAASPGGARQSRPRASFGPKPAVRVEGFDCLGGDGRRCGITAVA